MIIRKKITPFILLSPAVIMLLGLMLFPLAWSFFTSLKSMSLFDLMMHSGEFVGFSNYADIFQDSNFWNALKNSLIYVGISVIGQVAFGLLIASILHSKIVKFSGLFRALFLIPWITCSVVAAYSWIYFLDANIGFLPTLSLNFAFLKALGMDRRDWLTNPSIVIFVLSVINIWKGTAFSMLMQSAGFQSIPGSVFEAAKVDGANAIQRFFRITIPILSPFILINLVMTTMITFNIYDMILVITGGGPAHASEVLSLYVYNTGFVNGEIGYAAALSMILFAVNLIATVFYLKYLNPRRGNND
ncbi:MAG: hypothetical protein DRP32_07045 [Thermotogae bacterium]|uniref:carbohydrate ABC transporter permease n=1 Tax=Kosmotoga sp. TaxID=1955248 RepID=UPI000F2D6F6A|nr:sugar ABC transporter permease [Kosmotoga sp.]MBO8167300.1 sugar ABC transporter permease [Kosmotoga sp.]MCD6160316.1 sugar ABC transporter permease [Kosmotoga sp.]RKX48492.1 MAG: hypothetical protein DRP32_07045 [Thermotogota bacterium]